MKIKESTWKVRSPLDGAIQNRHVLRRQCLFPERTGWRVSWLGACKWQVPQTLPDEVNLFKSFVIVNSHLFLR
jgi:hypothetical protein